MRPRGTAELPAAEAGEGRQTCSKGYKLPRQCRGKRTSRGSSASQFGSDLSLTGIAG